MIQCKAPLQVEWRKKTITTNITKTGESTTTKFELSETMCPCFSEWCEKGRVKLINYSEEYHQAIWNNGKLSLEWLTFARKYIDNIFW
mmetsp:Transcript_49741/g.55530  ORF Transcript_49741/g.55530 Transcript_49741/m.55530 type:complete len:88 (+) Transcript_49741:2775-3038(+)